VINKDLPNNVFLLQQKEFQVVQGNPWTYQLSLVIRDIFRKYPALGEKTPIVCGMTTSDNTRFIRYWWEISLDQIGFGYINSNEALNSHKRWFQYMKGGGFRRWYGYQIYVVNWFRDGYEIKNAPSFPRAMRYYFQSGITYSFLSSSSFSARWSPPGFIFDMAGSSLFPKDPIYILGLLNTSLIAYLLKLINPTVNYQVGDLGRIPIPSIASETINTLVTKAISTSISTDNWNETTHNFLVPLSWQKGTNHADDVQKHLAALEMQINDQAYALFKINQNDRKDIEIELLGGIREVGESENSKAEDEELSLSVDINYLAFSWLSYTIGIVLCRFKPGTLGALGSAIYHRTDFAIGSLPEPTEEEFNELVGEPSQFVYIDEQGGRHVFSHQVEDALRKLALPDGIAVFDPNHLRDLPSLVSKALELMLGQSQAQEVIQQAAGGDLRKFLEKDFFTQHHIKQYRKRPIYWPIQSSKRSYGFVLFHEKIDRNTFYALQQEPYLPTKRRAVQLRLEELGKKVLTAQGAARKPIEKEMDELRQLGEELAQFAKDLDAITRGGYEPEADWIDDGVILRMAPLWSVIPLWKSEPKKYWEELAAGKYDWSRIAMKYWPERVKQACKKNKSFAIAQGHEEWFMGG